MRKFIKLNLLFSIPILILLISMELVIRSKPNPYAYKSNYLEKHSNEVEVLVLGNSHLYHGLNPAYIDKNTFNAAYVSQSLEYDWAILNKYKDHWKNLKYIITSMDNPTLLIKLSQGIGKWRIKDYVIYYGINHNSNIFDHTEVLSGKFSMKWDRFISTKSELTCDSLGWEDAVKKEDLISTGIAGAERHTTTIDSAIVAGNVKYVKAMLDFAQKRNIKIIFLSTPTYKSYYQHASQKQIQFTADKMAYLLKSYPNAVYYNLIKDTLFDKNDFNDGDHLNGEGAKKLSLLIDSIINKDSKNTQVAAN